MFTVYALSCEETSRPVSESEFLEVMDLLASVRTINIHMERAMAGKSLITWDKTDILFPPTTATQEARFEAMWKIVCEPDSGVYLA